MQLECVISSCQIDTFGTIFIQQMTIDNVPSYNLKQLEYWMSYSLSVESYQYPDSRATPPPRFFGICLEINAV